MAKPLSQIIKDLDKANDDYHAAVEDLLECEDLDVEQRSMVGVKAHNVFETMKGMSVLLDNYMS